MVVVRASRTVALCLALAGCTERYAPLSDAQLAVALRAQKDVDTAQLPELVQRIYDARLSDPAPDTTRSEYCRHQSACVYSRVATGELIFSYWSDPDLAGSLLGEQRVTEDAFTTRNIFLDIPGQSRPNEWILATAHYDAWYGGANDDGTGVAVLLAAAKPLLLARLDRSVRLLLVDGEELGMLGSGRYVEQYGTASVVITLNADSIAFVGEPGGALTRQPDGTEYIVQANEPSAAYAYQFADLARRMPKPTRMRSLIFPGDGVSQAGVAIGYDLSDHAQFWLNNAPAIFPFPAGDKPSWYHTADDTPDKVDADRLERMGRLWVGALAAFASVGP